MSINRIGYTNDGLVFVVIDGEIDGKPIQTITQMHPSVAHKVSMAIEKAATDAEERPNGIDSPTVN